LEPTIRIISILPSLLLIILGPHIFLYFLCWQKALLCIIMQARNGWKEGLTFGVIKQWIT